MTIKYLLLTNLFPVFVLKIGNPSGKDVCLCIWTVSKQTTVSPLPSEQIILSEGKKNSQVN